MRLPGQDLTTAQSGGCQRSAYRCTCPLSRSILEVVGGMMGPQCYSLTLVMLSGLDLSPKFVFRSDLTEKCSHLPFPCGVDL